MRNGTDVQSRMHLPGCYSSIDLNDNNGNSSWTSSPNVNRNSGQLNDLFLISMATDVRHEREQLRQVMLRHDSIFRHQLHELHRVYGIQREMMNEFKNRELNRHVVPVNTPESSTLSPRFLDEDKQKKWHALESEYALEDKQKIQRRLFDLERPANEYANIEEGGWGTSSMTGVESYPPRRKCEVSYLRDGSLSNNGDPAISNQCIKGTYGFKDLNDPIQVQDASNSALVDILGKVTKYRDDVKRKDQSSKSPLEYRCLAMECYPASSKGRKDCISCRNFPLETEGMQEWLFHNVEIGRSRFTSGSYPEDLGRSTKSLQVGHAMAQPDLFCSYAQSENERCVNKIFGVEIPERISGESTATLNALDQQVVGARSGMTKSESLSMNWKRFSPSLDQDLLRTTSSSSYSPNIRGAMSHQKGIILSSASESNAFHVSCSSVGSHNQNGNSCSNFASEELARYGTVSLLNHLPDSSRKMENPHRGSSWLEVSKLYQNKAVEKAESSYHKSLAFSQNRCQQSVDKPELKKSPSQSCTRDSLQATRVDDTEDRRTEACDTIGNKKIFGFSIPETTSKDFLIPSFPLKSNSPTSADGTANSTTLDMVEGLVMEEKLNNQNVDMGHPIDLNLSITEEVEVEDAQSIPSSPKTKEEIDLEAPLTIESESSAAPACESLQSNLKEPSTSSQVETKDTKDVLCVSAAAEALVAISVSNALNLQEMDTSVCEALCWFAEVVSSFECDGNDKVGITSLDKDGDCDEFSVRNEIDYFEFMTLNINENKMEDVYCKPDFHLHQQERKPLPRRGQARRGRKRKDFQRDVLPNLTSLTRNEATKDINAIEGLLRASGGNWQSALMQKKNAKGGSTKGNSRSGGSTQTKAASCLNRVQQRKLCSEERSFVVSGWGKRTRRPPRQRCVLSNPPLLVK